MMIGRYILGDDLPDDPDFADDATAEDQAFEDALDVDQGGDPLADVPGRWDDGSASPSGGYDTSQAYGPGSYAPSASSPYDAGYSPAPVPAGAPGPVSPGTPTPQLPPPTQTPTIPAGAGGSDTPQLDLLQQDVDDAEQAYLDAYQADLDALSDYWATSADDSSTSDDIAAAAALVKPLAAALPPLYDAVGRAQAALDAAKRQGVTGSGLPPRRAPKGSGSISAEAKALHAKTATVHAQSQAFHAKIQKAGKPMTAQEKARARSLREQRGRLALERRKLRPILQAAVRKSGGSPPKTPSPPRTPPRAPADPPARRPQAPPARRQSPRIHGTAWREAVEYLGGGGRFDDRVGDLDAGSVLSSFVPALSLFTGGGKKSGPSQADQMAALQLQMRQAEAQAERDAAKRAETTAWVVGGVAATGLLGTILYIFGGKK